MSKDKPKLIWYCYECKTEGPEMKFDALVYCTCGKRMYGKLVLPDNKSNNICPVCGYKHGWYMSIKSGRPNIKKCSSCNSEWRE